MQWLEENLLLAYPFVDQVNGPIVGVFADAQVVTPVNGPLTLTIFDPQALTNARVQIKSGATVVLDTTTATVGSFDAYTVLRGTDSGRGSSFTFILSTAAVALFANQPTPVDFVPAVLNVTSGQVSSVNGLSGDVVLDFPTYTVLTISGNLVTIDAQDPADRVDCSSTDCSLVFSLNTQTPDNFGSLALSNTGCHRLVPHPTNPHELLIFNFCTPCLDCADIDSIGAYLTAQADYYHQLSAIYHDQFNRYQISVAAANAADVAAAARADIVSDLGPISIGGRAFNRPYFTQLALALTNSSTYTLSIALTVAIEDGDVAAQLSPVPNSASIERYLKTGDQFETFAGFPGSLTVVVGPEESVAISSEMHRSSINNAAATGTWTVTAVITYTAGASTLPVPATITKTFDIQLYGAEPTADP